ncbi:MAG: response regulator [bacterium]|nr:response regulator [bacterium]MDT8366627.1 response regulator [bacterium]
MGRISKKILIVEDVQMFVQIQKTLLNRQDFTLLTARSGQGALDAARQEKPDLILLDLYMPDMNGYDVCRELKSDPATEHIPILIIITGDAEDLKEMCIEAGCDGHLTKPIRKDTFIPAIESHLQVPPRGHSRVRIRIPCTITDEDGKKEGIIHTLTPRGAFIETDPPLLPGEILNIDFTLDDTGAKLSLLAAVRWSRKMGDSHPGGGGCEFTDIGPEELDSIRSYLALRSNDIED